MDILGHLVRTKRKLDTKVTNKNKDKLTRDLNRIGKDYGLQRLSKDASIKDIRDMKKLISERLGYDILDLSVREGNTTIASIEGKELKKSKDKDISKLATYAEQLAEAKRQADKKLTPSEKAFLERGNQNIKGYGNQDITTLFEGTKTKKQIQNLINEIKNSNPKEEYYNKQIDTFEKVFQKIGITRENDLEKLKDKIKSMDFIDSNSTTNYLLNSLELYGSDQEMGQTETELANARLDSMMLKTGLKTTGKKKVDKVLKKYSSKE